MVEHTRSFSVSPELYPFEDHWFERHGTAMHYVDTGGSGMPVVMMHGNPTWSFLYRDIIKDLGDEVRALAPDYPGFGFSQHPPGYGYLPREHSEWVSAWLDSLKLERFVMVVQDWGGPIGFSVATERPEQIAGMVILNTWAWPADLPAKIFSHAMGGPIGKYLNLKRNFFADKLVKQATYYSKRKAPEVFDAYTAPFPTPQSRQGTYIFPKAIRTEGAWLSSIEQKLSRLNDKPIEMVWGMKDLAFGKEAYIQRWLRYFPNARVERHQKASHYLQEDQPEAIAEAVRRVISRA